MIVPNVALRRLSRHLALPVALMLLGGLGAPSVQASVTFDFTSKVNPELSNGGDVEAGDLPATVTLSFANDLDGVGGSLDITIDNLTGEDPTIPALIRQFYFNAENAGTLSFAGTSIDAATLGGWAIKAPSQGDGFGQFDYELTFGGQRGDWVGPDASRTISFRYTGTMSDSDLLAFSSGENGSYQAVVHWVPVDESLVSGYGSGSVNPVPEPATLAAVLSGAIPLGLAGLCRLRRRREATSA